MNVYQLEEYIKLVIKQKPIQPTYIYSDDTYKAKVNNILQISVQTLPNHVEYLKAIYKEVNKEDYNYFTLDNTVNALKHILEIISIEKLKPKEDKNKIFETGLDKYKQSTLFFKEENYPSLFNCLNSSLELLLKESLDLPSVTKIPTSNIIEKLVKNKIDPYIHLREARKYVIDIDNKVKHQGYNPSKKDAINGMKIMEELLEQLNEKKIIISEELRNEIYEML